MIRIVLAVVSVACLAAQASEKLELTDIFQLEYVSDPQISADGGRILYVRNFKDIMTDRNLSNIWIVNRDGSRNRPLTTGNQNDFSPRWAPDGKSIIYKSNADGKVQLYKRWLDDGSVQKLTHFASSPGGFVISPDGRWIAMTMFVPSNKSSPIKIPGKPAGAKWNDPPRFIDDLKYRSDGSGYVRPGNTQIFVMSSKGGTARQLTDSEYNHGSISWTANSKSILYSANSRADRDYAPWDSEVFRISANGGDATQLTDREDGPDYSPKMSPDGKHIAYLGYDQKFLGFQHARIYVMNADGSNSRIIPTNITDNISNIRWNDDSDGIFFTRLNNGRTTLNETDLNGRIKTLANNVDGVTLGRPYNGGQYSVAKNGRYAYTYGSVDHPADLGVGRGTTTRRLTTLNDDVLRVKKTGKVEEIRYKSNHDGRDIQGWIVYPPDFDKTRKYPFVLEIHGGPFSSYGYVFSMEVQLFAAAGYVVLYTNPRGSTGYGAEFANQIHHNYPGQDYDDLMSGVDAVIQKGFIDDSELYVTGGSGGGVLTAWIVGKTNRFKAAVVAKPVINWVSFVLYADAPAFFAKFWFPNLPWENPKPYLERSPLSLVGNVSTPTMLLTGEQDFRTPMPESEQYYAALKIRKVESALVRIPGASHGIASRPSNLMAKVASILYWFEKHRENE